MYNLQTSLIGIFSYRTWLLVLFRIVLATKIIFIIIKWEHLLILKLQCLLFCLSIRVFFNTMSVSCSRHDLYLSEPPKYPQLPQRTPENIEDIADAGYVNRSSIYRIGHTDKWGCKKCNMKDDKWFIAYATSIGFLSKIMMQTKLYNNDFITS